MGKKFLIDTNVLLEYIGSGLPVKANKFMEDVVAEDFNISVINRIEVLGHSSATEAISTFLDLANQFELTSAVVNQTIELWKIRKIKLPDAIIAATAVEHNLTLVSRNVKDFQNIAGLQLLNPREL